MALPNAFQYRLWGVHVHPYARRHPGKGVSAPHDVPVVEHWRETAVRRNPFVLPRARKRRANPFTAVSMALNSVHGFAGAAGAYFLNKGVFNSIRDVNAMEYFDDAGKTSADTPVLPANSFYTVARWACRALVGALAAMEYGSRYPLAHTFNGALQYPTASEALGPYT